MAVCFWICLWTSVTAVFSNAAAQSPPYRLLNSQMTFDQALEACSPGLLTTLATKPEADTILDLISSSVSPLTPEEFTFWVGLRKAKNECVVSMLPLRGFKWTADGSEVTQVSRWAEEPEHTCTTVRCAALKVQVHGSAVTGWGLIPVSCKKKYQFICKLKDSQTVEPPEPTEPHPEPTSAEPEPRRSEPTSDTRNPETSHSQPHQGPEQEPGSGSCRRPSRSVARSLILDPKDPGRIQVECWSAGALVDVRCWGRPARWRLPDGAVANFSSICVPCDDGFQRSSSGTCEDIDECSSGAPCRNNCLNTPGSYRCVCTDDNGDLASEDSAVCKDSDGGPNRGVASGLLIPLLVAVVALVVLVVLVALMIKCCMMRRSKRRAAKKAEKMSMDSKDERK